MKEKSFQDYYPENVAYCYGCGPLNEYGHHIQSYWDGDESICTFTPEPYHISIQGYVYGGLIASLIDCHSTGTAAAAKYRAEGRPMDSKPTMRFVTASLKVDYLKPTPLGIPLKLRSTVAEVKGRKVTIHTKLFANEALCATGEVIAVQLPENWAAP